MLFVDSGSFVPAGYILPGTPSFATIAGLLRGLISKIELDNSGAQKIFDIVVEGLPDTPASRARIQLEFNPDGSRSATLTVNNSSVTLVDRFVDVANENFADALLAALLLPRVVALFPAIGASFAVIEFIPAAIAITAFAVGFLVVGNTLVAQEFSLLLDDPHRAVFYRDGEPTDFGVYVPDGSSETDANIISFFLRQASLANGFESGWLNGNRIVIGSVYTLVPDRAAYDIYNLDRFEHFLNLTGSTVAQMSALNGDKELRLVTVTGVGTAEPRHYLFQDVDASLTWNIAVPFGDSRITIRIDNAYDVDSQGRHRYFGRGDLPGGNMPGMPSGETVLITSLSDSIITGFENKSNVILANDVESALFGGNNADVLLGSRHRDQIHGGAGADRIDGAGGDDLIRGATDGDVVYGGAGFDTWDYDTTLSGLKFGIDTDRITVTQQFDPGRNATGYQIERLVGGASDDHFIVTGPRSTAITIAGVDAQDTLTIDGLAITGRAVDSVTGRGIYNLGSMQLSLGADGALTIDGRVRIEHFQEGMFGLSLGTGPLLARPDTRLEASDFTPYYGRLFATPGGGFGFAADAAGAAYIMHFGPNGLADSPTIRIPQIGSIIQIVPSALTMADGTVYVVWQDIVNASWALMGQHVAADGSPIGQAQQIGTGYYAIPPGVAQSSDGLIFIATRAMGDTTGYLRTYDPTTDTLGATQTINNSRDAISLTALSNGNILATWGDAAVFGQIFRPNGQSNGGWFQLNSQPSGPASNPVTAATSTGFVVAWLDTNAGSGSNGTGIRIGWFGADGTPIGDTKIASTGSINWVFSPPPAIAVLADGTVVVAWTQATYIGDNPGGDMYDYNYDIVARLYSGSGVAIGSEFVVNRNVDGSQAGPTIAALANGGFAIGWGHQILGGIHGAGGGLPSGHYVRIFDGNGNAVAAGAEINGTPLADRLFGTDGGDVINGRAGADHMLGGLGDDRYVIDGQADLVFEKPGEGVDTIISSSGFYLYANVENLSLASGSGDIFGVGNELANVMTGNEGANLLLGGKGDDSIRGGAGIDILYGEMGDDQLFGDADNDFLAGGAGNDMLDGDAGGDSLYGEAGDDHLIGGSDFVFDRLVGGDGNDILRGDSGLGDYDHLYGDAGDDAFYVDTGDDLTFEQPGGGTDTVYANVAGANNGVYLYANIENLVLLGTTSFGVGNGLGNRMTGNEAANWLLGGAGDDSINGRQGNDVLFGEAGRDVFIFEQGTGGDVIGDFLVGTDRIDLSSLGFTTFSGVQAAMHQHGNDLAIDLGRGDLIILLGVSSGQLRAGDFILAASASLTDHLDSSSKMLDAITDPFDPLPLGQNAWSPDPDLIQGSSKGEASLHF
jgi:Ca2+-binding RTX toxin-like protein